MSEENSIIQPIVEQPTECKPCQQKAFVDISQSICKDAEATNGIESGKCDLIQQDLSNQKIDLPTYTKNIVNLLPEEQKEAMNVLIEVAQEKHIIGDLNEPERVPEQ